MDISELHCLIRNKKKVHLKYDTYIGSIIIKAVTQEIELHTSWEHKIRDEHDANFVIDSQTYA